MLNLKVIVQNFFYFYIIRPGSRVTSLSLVSQPVRCSSSVYNIL